MIHRTPAAAAAVHESGWAELDAEWEVTAIPVVDPRHLLPNGEPLFARLTYADALEVARREGAELLGAADVEQLRRVGLQLEPFLGTPRAEVELVHSERHDAAVWRQLAELGWDRRLPVAGAGKHWIAGAPEGRSRLMGWDVDGAGPGLRWWQDDAVAHNDQHHDDGTTTPLKRRRSPPTGHARPSSPSPADTSGAGGGGVRTLRLQQPRMVGPDVAIAQRAAQVTADGVYGPLTAAGVKRWQAANGLVPDGVFGPKSWAAIGVAVRPLPGDPRAPACLAALRDADERWPGRKRISDGIMGDAAHQAKPSDHNLGNAVDITHDLAAGCSGDTIAELAIADPRTTYVIWNRHIYNRARAAEGWRKYTGSNGHTHHVHISVRADRRHDAGPWGWAP